MQGRDRIDASKLYEQLIGETCEGGNVKECTEEITEQVLDQHDLDSHIDGEENNQEIDKNIDTCDEFYDVGEECVEDVRSDMHAGLKETRSQSMQQAAGIVLQKIFIYPVKSCAGFEVRKESQFDATTDIF